MNYLEKIYISGSTVIVLLLIIGTLVFEYIQKRKKIRSKYKREKNY